MPGMSTQTNRGAKQHNHMISRSDHFSTARQSITAVTSTWSDGTAGPLGLCFAANAFAQKDVDRFNKEHEGEAFMFSSESHTHFMSGNTFQTLLHGLLTAGYAKKRHELGITKNARGLLLADAWSGFHSFKTGLDKAREAWSLTNNVALPELQVAMPKNNDVGGVQ